MGLFYYAAKAFDVLERLEPNPEYWEGKRGACVGVFQMIIAGHEPKYVLQLLQLKDDWLKVEWPSIHDPMIAYHKSTIRLWLIND